MKPIIAGVLMCLPLCANAAIIHEDPGNFFLMPQPNEAYIWSLDLSSAEAGDVIESFTVFVLPGLQDLKTFQIFGSCDGGSTAWHAGFDLSVSNNAGTDTEWTSATRGSGGGCGYHDYLDQTLAIGANTFEITYTGADNIVPPALQTAQLRFGAILPAIPLPPGLALLSGALGVLGLGAARRRRP